VERRRTATRADPSSLSADFLWADHGRRRDDMPIKEWSETITIGEMNDEPSFSEDMESLIARIEEAEDAGPDIIINLENVTYLNSSNIAQLLKLRKVLQNLEARMRICGAADAVWSVMMVTGLDKVFEFTDDVTTSLASLQLLSD
jgi:anti-anti-sigma factor